MKYFYFLGHDYFRKYMTGYKWKITKEHNRNSFLFNSDRGQFYEFTSAHTEYRYEIEKSGKCVKEN